MKLVLCVTVLIYIIVIYLEYLLLSPLAVGVFGYAQMDGFGSQSGKVIVKLSLRTP